MEAVAHAEHGHAFIPPHEFPADEWVGRATLGKVGMWIFLLSDALSFAGLLLGYGILRGGSAVWWRQGEPDFGINFTAALTFLLICSSVTMVLAYSAAVENNRKQLCFFLALTALGGIFFLCGQVKEWFGLKTHPLLLAILVGAGALFAVGARAAGAKKKGAASILLVLAVAAGLLFVGLQRSGLFAESFHPGLSKEGLLPFWTGGATTFRAAFFYIITGFHGMHVTTGVIYLLTMLVRAMAGKYDHGNYNSIEVCGLFWHFVDLIWIIVFTLVYLVPSNPGT